MSQLLQCPLCLVFSPCLPCYPSTSTLLTYPHQRKPDGDPGPRVNDPNALALVLYRAPVDNGATTDPNALTFVLYRASVDARLTLARYRGPKPNGTWKLPTDINLNIMDQLDPVSRMCFDLTCRYLH